MFKVHHSLADGIAIVLMNSLLTDNPDVKEFPRITARISVLQQIGMYLILPLNILYCTYMIFCVMPVQLNGFISSQNKDKLTPVKNACFSPDIPIEMLKALAKEQGGTLNDVLMTVLSLSFSQYLTEYTSDKTTKQLWMSCPFSLRPPPKHVLDFSFDNEFAILPIKMQLVDNYQSGF